MIQITKAPVPTEYLTKTVTSYATYCPEATTFTVQGKTYTANATNVWVPVACPNSCTVVVAPTPTVLPLG
jgi:glucose dehydrogenase